MRLHIQLVYALLISNVTLRPFTNYLPLLPKHLNILDVGITAVLFVMFLWYRTLASTPRLSASVVRRLILFNAVLLMGTLLNVEAIYVPAAVAQWVMLNEPILLFIALVNMPVTLPQIHRFASILRGLILFEFLLGVLQFPLFVSTGNSEVMVGTFFGNAEQYTGFLVLGICYYLGLIKTEPARKQRYSMLIIAMLCILPLVDNKASWLGVIVALYYVMSKLGKLGRGFSERVKHAFVFLLLFAIGCGIATTASATLGKFEGVYQAWQTDNFTNLGKIKAYQDIFAAFWDNPHMVFIGSGPGTFYSRAGNQFYFIIPEDMYFNPSAYQRRTDTRASNSMAGVVDPTYTVAPFFKRFYANHQIYSIGSGQVDSPFSSYAGLLGETGFLGLIIYVSVYIGALRRLGAGSVRYRHDPNIFPLIMTCIGFLIYVLTVSMYNPWLETGRMTTMLWAMIAMVFKYENHSEKAAEVIDGGRPAAPFYWAKHRHAAAVSG